MMGPYTVFAIGSGYAFSHAYDNIAVILSISTASVFIGAWSGAIIAFLFGRHLCRKRVRDYSQKNRILRAIDATLETQGLKLIILLRLSLLVPFNFSNYFFGGSAVKAFDFILGTIGLLPMVIFFSYVGTTMKNIEEVASG